MVFANLVLTGGSSITSTVADVISTNNINFTGILNEVVGLLPTVLPTLVGFIAIRKGISFLIGSLRRA